jgi:hypothetical protein
MTGRLGLPAHGPSITGIGLTGLLNPLRSVGTQGHPRALGDRHRLQAASAAVPAPPLGPPNRAETAATDEFAGAGVSQLLPIAHATHGGVTRRALRAGAAGRWVACRSAVGGAEPGDGPQVGGGGDCKAGSEQTGAS